MRLIDAEQWVEELKNCQEDNKDCNQWLVNEIDSRHTVYTGDEDRTVRIVFSREHWGSCYRCPSCGARANICNRYCPGCGKLISWEDPEERADMSSHEWFVLLQEQEKAKTLNQKDLSEMLYKKLCQLREYEKTGLTPGKVMELKEQQKSDGWIPCSERMPKPEEEVLILTKDDTVTTAMYEDGTIYESDSSWFWYDCDFEYDRDAEEYIISEGWWEYKHFNSDCENNHAVDEEVVAWMPLPKTYKT